MNISPKAVRFDEDTKFQSGDHPPPHIGARIQRPYPGRVRCGCLPRHTLRPLAGQVARSGLFQSRFYRCRCTMLAEWTGAFTGYPSCPLGAYRKTGGGRACVRNPFDVDGKRHHVDEIRFPIAHRAIERPLCRAHPHPAAGAGRAAAVGAPVCAAAGGEPIHRGGRL
jgi:hypothetical protein